MRVTVDTNILVRAAIGDDEGQEAIANRVLRGAELVAVPAIVLCELVWVLQRSYRISRGDIADMLRALIAAPNVKVSETTAMGLAFLDAGADFADGIVAVEGRRLGGDAFVSFDEKAVAAAEALGLAARTP